MNHLEMLNGLPPWEWPPDAAEMLAKILVDSRQSAADRAEAAELAGDLPTMDDTMAEVLLDLANDAAQPDEVRTRAAIALGPVLESCEMEGFDDDVLSDPPILRETFDRIQDTLHRLYADTSAPKDVRRRALEASVRSPQDWHPDAVRTAYASSDEEWKLTGIFGMRWIAGFDDEIMQALQSRNPQIHLEAVQAAGSQETEAAWPHIASLIESRTTAKDLRLAAIEAAAGMPAEEAQRLLSDLVDSEDEDIAAAADEALMMADSREEYDELDSDELEDEDGDDRVN
ncbi:MAG: hypothetical protein C5B56_01840 [Proteobacteria bacterium]|nr:MAG: hypothetical protein C5B56_01840 [Pseudomonadota bacterium]